MKRFVIILIIFIGSCGKQGVPAAHQAELAEDVAKAVVYSSGNLGISSSDKIKARWSAVDSVVIIYLSDDLSKADKTTIRELVEKESQKRNIKIICSDQL